MNKQLVKFASDQCDELIAALTSAKINIQESFDRRMNEAFADHQKLYASSSRLARWFYGIESYETVESFCRCTEDWGWKKHFSQKWITDISDMIHMLKTSPPPTEILIDYDFWNQIVKNK